MMNKKVTSCIEKRFFVMGSKMIPVCYGNNNVYSYTQTVATTELVSRQWNMLEEGFLIRKTFRMA